MPLDSLRLIRVAGNDRVAFLQGQLTQDLRRVTPTRGARYAWADAQGRVLVSGEVFAWLDALWLTVPATLAEPTAQRLRQFVLRSKVAVEVGTAAVAGRFLPGGGPATLHEVALATDPLACTATGQWCALRTDTERLLLAAPAAALPALLAGAPGTPADADRWALGDIRAGFARPAASPGAFIPQMLNLDLAGAVSFDKGCYSGQEVVTRTRHLGRLKRRLFRYRASDPLPAPGDPVFDANGESGTVVMAAPAEGAGEILAVVRLDAARQPLFAGAGGQRPLALMDLPYEVPGT